MSRLQSIVVLLFILIAMQFEHIGIMQVESVDPSNFNASYPTHVTTRTIERVETFSNGCYKQRIIEPDLWNAARYFETEQLICPPAVNASTFTILTQQIHRNNSANHTNYFIPANSTHTAVLSHPAHVAPAESTPVAFMPPPASHPVNPTVQHQQPFNPAVFTSNATSHVALLSKKTGFYDHEMKKNSANSLNNFNGILVFVVTAIFFDYNQNHLRQ